jgi:hypothetical protein
MVILTASRITFRFRDGGFCSVSLLCNRSRLDCFNVAQFVAQQAPTEPDWL